MFTVKKVYMYLMEKLRSLRFMLNGIHTSYIKYDNLAKLLIVLSVKN